MEKLSQVMFVMLCHLTCVAKQIVFHLNADKIDKLIAGLDGEYRESGSPRCRGGWRLTRVCLPQSRC